MIRPPAQRRHRLAKTLALTLLMAAAPGASATDVRQDIVIVGSSTVYPFTSFVAEYFGLSSRFSSPRVESTGTGGGFKQFCSGLGLVYPDINNASRAIKPSEVELCRANGVERVLEVAIGQDSIVLVAKVGSALKSMSVREIYLALARWIPDPGTGELVENSHSLYSDINPDHPPLPIRMLGPPPTSGTRDAFVELVLERACAGYPRMAALRKADRKEFNRRCLTIREDGVFIEAGENDNLILRKVADGESGTLGITGFNFYIQNLDIVKALKVEGIAPSRRSVLAGRYPISRPLFIYVKSQHIDVVPGLVDFIDLFLSDFIMGDDGQLGDLGLITPGRTALARTRELWARDKNLVFKPSPGHRSRARRPGPAR